MLRKGSRAKDGCSIQGQLEMNRLGEKEEHNYSIEQIIFILNTLSNHSKCRRHLLIDIVLVPIQSIALIFSGWNARWLEGLSPVFPLRLDFSIYQGDASGTILKASDRSIFIRIWISLRSDIRITNFTRAFSSNGVQDIVDFKFSVSFKRRPRIK